MKARMKKSIVTTILIILFIGNNLPCQAQKQTKTAVYSGRVADPQGDAIEYATIVLLQTERQKAGATTDSAGRFSVEAKVGSYTLVVQCLGYEPMQKEIHIPAVLPDILTLKPAVFALKDVVVQAHNIKREADRFVVNVSPTTGKDGTELLSQAPGVWLSGDKISINGASGVKVFVDQREIKLSGEELLSYLRSIKSADIRQIEVIPVAGAEFDANSSGGIIQFSLRRRLNNGMQGNIMMGTTLSPSFNRYLPSGTVTARVGKWTINGAASATFSPKDESEMKANRIYSDNKTNFSSLSQFNLRSNYGTGRIGTIFEIDTMNSIGAEIEYIGQISKGGSVSQTTLSKEAMLIDSEGDYYQRNKYNTCTATANYLHKFDDQGSTLKLIIDYANKKSDGNNDYRIIQKMADSKSDSTYRSNATATYDIMTANLSYTKHIRKVMSIQAGLKYTHTDMNDNSDYEGLLHNGNWEINPAYGHVLKYNENIMGAHAAFSTEISRWSLKAGLRGEYTRTSNRSDESERDYIDLFPNLNVTYAFNPMKTQMLVGQYARNIERPAFYTLSPNHIQLSDYSYQIGNPYLKPTYINRFSLTWVYNYRYTVTVGGNLHHNLIREFSKQDVHNPDVSFITFENHARENHWFIALNAPFQPARWCSLSVNLVGLKQDIKMTKVSAFGKHYLMFANATATFYLPANYNIELQYGGASRLYSGNSEVAPRHTLDFTARKKCMNDRLLITAGVNNIFGRYNDYANNMETYRTQSHYKEAHAGRVFKVSLSWSFNSGKKVDNKQIERSLESGFNRLNKN